MRSATEAVSANQMALLFFVFMTGSSIINIPGPVIGAAGNGAWISLLLSGSVGIVLLACMLYLNRKHPGMTYVDYSRQLVGRPLSILLILLSVSYFLQIVIGIVLDVGLFLNSSMMRETPLFVFHLLVYLTAAATVRSGLETMCRMFVIITGFVTFFIGLVLLLAIPNYHVEFFLPVMPEGFRPVLHGAYISFGFPYAELFVFGMLLAFVRSGDRKKLPRSMMGALLVNIAILCISTVCTIMTFGPLAGDRKYSLFEVARMVEVQEILQRIEAAIGMSLIAGSYMKVSVALYALNLILVQLCRLNSRRILVFPLALFFFLATSVWYDGQQRWIEIVSTVLPLWTVVAFVFPLVVLTIVSMVRGKPKPASSSSRGR